MIKLIVWGLGETQKRFERYLAGDRAEIVAYTYSDATDNIEKAWGGG